MPYIALKIDIVMATALTAQPKRQTNVPDYLIYEVLGDQVLYYKGYRDVLKGSKKPADIMGSSDIQGLLVGVLFAYLFNRIDRKKYRLATNEIGLNIPVLGKAANDIAIFDKAATAELRGKYFNVAPRVVIEVDLKVDIDPEQYPAGEQDYFYDKTDRLLAAGVEKVIWITTHTKKTFIATKGEKWVVQTWQDDLPVLDECVLNIAQILIDEELNF
jgi:hypothetical protein